MTYFRLELLADHGPEYVSSIHSQPCYIHLSCVLELSKDFLYIDDEYTVKVGNKRKRIDRLVYDLYGLTEDEIRIVEGNI